MAINIEDGPAALQVTLSGKLTKEDYEHFVPSVEARIADQGKVRMVVTMTDFHGWTPAAMWEDTKFATRHFRDIERVAMVGDSAWEHGMAVFCKPFTGAKLRYFDLSEAAEAEEWVAA